MRPQWTPGSACVAWICPEGNIEACVHGPPAATAAVVPQVTETTMRAPGITEGAVGCPGRPRWAPRLHLRNFDIILRTANGTTYNAYVVRGETGVAVIDNGEGESFADDFFRRSNRWPATTRDHQHCPQPPGAGPQRGRVAGVAQARAPGPGVFRPAAPR